MAQLIAVSFRRAVLLVDNTAISPPQRNPPRGLVGRNHRPPNGNGQTGKKTRNGANPIVVPPLPPVHVDKSSRVAADRAAFFPFLSLSSPKNTTE